MTPRFVLRRTGKIIAMSFRKILFLGVAALLCGASSMHAQFSIYGTVVGERVGGFTCADPQGRCADTDGHERPFGSNFGAFYDFKSYKLARFGADVRGGVTNANKSATSYGASSDLVRHYSALAGPRASFRTPLHALKPYAEVLGGYARYNDANTTQQFGQIEGYVGLDVSIVPFLDLRAIELGEGEMFGSGSHNVQSIGAGLVLHF